MSAPDSNLPDNSTAHAVECDACSAGHLLRALMAYEVANFREWDHDRAWWGYHNHAPTQRAVKTIAQIFSQNAIGEARAESATPPHQKGN